MKTKKLMKLLMAWPMPRNQARKIVAGARKIGISNDETLGAFRMGIVGAPMKAFADVGIPVLAFDDIEVYGGEM